MGDPDGIENDILAGADLDNEVLDPACRGPLNDGSDVTNMTCPDDLQCGVSQWRVVQALYWKSWSQ